jgi:zona occludens toxin
MSVTLITGVPGSGKTLKAVWDHLRPYVGEVTKVENDRGEVVEIPSVVFTNINSLQVDHELIEGGGTWALLPDKQWKYTGNELALRNWQNWAKPGAKIFFDEFQKFWPPRPNGAPVPPDLQALDTHRHMGVDFVLITQNCRNVDRHILGLVDRHLHVRRVANMPLAVVYEWDHASVSLLYRNSITKSPWRYPRKAYKLYKSAELHTKQKRKIPGLVWFIMVGLIGAAYLGPTFANRLADRVQGKSSNSVDLPKGGQKQEFIKDGMLHTIETSTTTMPAASASAPVAAAAAPVIAGCIATAKRCACLDSDGLPVDVEPKVCADRTGQGRPPPVQFVDSERTLPPGAVASDYETRFVN